MLHVQQPSAPSDLHWEEYAVQGGDPKEPLEVTSLCFLSKSASFSLLPS